MLKSFRELEVWQKAHRLVLQMCAVTERFPDRERYGIVSQVRRSAASIPANIAEGFGRRTTRELLQFFGERKWIAGRDAILFDLEPRFGLPQAAGFR